MNEARPPYPRTAGGERKRVTVLFADMVDFTPTAERLGEEGAYELTRRIYGLTAAAVKEYGGSVENFTGDGIMALFGVPVALEDATLRACKAALLIQERLAAAREDFVAAFALRPQLRIGINTGPVVAGQMEAGRAGVSGDTINFAARLQSVAVPETITLSETAYRQVEGLVQVEFVGDQNIKGKSAPQKVFRLDGVKQDAVRFDTALCRGLTAYVGRTREREVLARELAAATSGLRVVDLVAEAGMGKSRLLHEFLQTIDRDETVVLRGNCASDGAQTAFGLFVDIVRSSFSLTTADPHAEIVRKLDDGLSALGLHSPENQSLLLNLLGLRATNDFLKGLEGTAVGLRTRSLLRGLLHERCSRGPTVLLLEDLHWIDRVSEDLLGEFVASEQSLPLLLLHTRRPEHAPPWMETRRESTLALERLSTDEITYLVQHRLGTKELPAPLADLVRERADGNALFAEEITSFLIERGVIARDGTTGEIDKSAVATMLPPNVQALLTARVDRLDVQHRALLQAAAVIGRSFDRDILDAIVDRDADVKTGLSKGVDLDFLDLDSQSGAYVFKHALVRDALYESLLSGPRADLHLKVAERIESRSHNRHAEVAETLASHFSQTNRDDKAFTYLAMAGRKSLGTYALTEAEAYFRRAEALLDKAPTCATDDGVIDFLTGYVLLLQLAYEPRELDEKIEKHRAMMDRLGDRAEVAVVLHYEVWALIWQCRFCEAKIVQARLSRMVGRIDSGVAYAYSEAGFFFLDALTSEPSADIEQRGNKALAAALSSGDSYIIAWLRFVVAWNAFHRGYMTRAHALATDLSRTGSEMRDPRSAALALWLHCWAAVAGDRPDEALGYAEKAIETAITPFDVGNGRNGKGTALVLSRRGKEAAAVLADVRTTAAEHGRWYELTGNDLSFGISIILEGDFARGVRHIEASMAKREQEGYKTVADWYRLGLCRLYIDILEGKDKPPMSLMAKNAIFILKTMLTGKNRLAQLLLQLENSSLYRSDSFHGGSIHFAYGKYHMLRKDRVQAAAHFKAAEEILSLFGDSPTLRKAREELIAIGRPEGVPMSLVNF